MPSFKKSGKKKNQAMTPKDITCYMQNYMASVPAELYVIEADAIHNVLHTPCHLRAGLLDIY